MMPPMFLVLLPLALQSAAGHADELEPERRHRAAGRWH